jgi:hypothetical protein
VAVKVGHSEDSQGAFHFVFSYNKRLPLGSVK